MAGEFDRAYFNRLRAMDERYFERIKKIPYENYRNVDRAAIAALDRVWRRSNLEGLEYAGVLYYRSKGGRRIFGFGPAEQGLGFASVVRWKMPVGVRGFLAGLYHTHPTQLLPGQEDKHSEVDRRQAKKIGGPVFLSTPSGEVKKYTERRGIRDIGKLIQPESYEAEYLRQDSPTGETLRLHQERQEWLLKSLP